MLLRVGPSKPSARAVRCAVERQRAPGERARTERAARDAAAQVGEALGVAPEHLDEGEPVMRESHRLRALQVRVAGQHRVDVLAGARDQHAAQLERGRGARRGRRRAGRARGRSRPGRCGCDRCAAARPPRRSARAAASRRSCGCLRGAGRAAACRLPPRRGSPRGPATIASASACGITPARPSMRACAIEPRMS